jgi:hypothetical protein
MKSKRINRYSFFISIYFRGVQKLFDPPENK